jgi:hypothetical protein
VLDGVTPDSQVLARASTTCAKAQGPWWRQAGRATGPAVASAASASTPAQR